MKSNEFLDFLKPSEFRHSQPGSRSPPELTGMKLENSFYLHDVSLKFYKIEKKSRNLQVKLVRYIKIYFEFHYFYQLFTIMIGCRTKFGRDENHRRSNFHGT